MSKNLTKNARWICALVESVPDRATPLSKPYRIVMTTGRWNWNILEMEALNEAIDFSRCKLIGTFLVDVKVYPYAKDYENVKLLAKRYFKRKLKEPSDPLQSK